MKLQFYFCALLISASPFAKEVVACKINLEDTASRETFLRLSPEEMSNLRGQYESMGPDDEPPFPVGGMSKIDDELMTAVRKTGEDSVVNILVTVSSQGNPESVSFSGYSYLQLPKYMAGYLMRQKYKPALCNCNPCRQEFFYYRDISIRPVR
jgi:hypothetical protein